MGKIDISKNAKHKKTDQILEEVMHLDAHMVQETLNEMNREAFAIAVDTLLRSRGIYVLGVRSSAPLAEYLAFYLNTIFPCVRLIRTNSASEIYEQMLHVGAKDAVIGISFSCNLLAKSSLSTIVDSMTAPLSLINALVAALCMKKKKNVLANLEELDRIWDDYPVNSHDEINRLDEEIKLSKQEQ